MKRCQKEIEVWYQKNKRNLPWRKDKEPYHVWISEIMLQQTRIEAVINYYQKFMQEIPTIQDLSKIEEEKLLKLWEGLGYYNRARNLKKAAQKIESEYQGDFPNSYDKLRTLPGIGDYTASAIASICFDEAQATIDGNVLRVYTRFYNDNSNIDSISTKKKIQKEIIKILPKKSGEFNEALMEIGETICIPNGVPICQKCPLKKYCQSKKLKNYLNLPVRSEKKAKKIIKYTVFLLKYQNQVIIKKRTTSSLLKNLWEFPNIEGHLTLPQVKKYLQKKNFSYSKIKKSNSYTHIFTHQSWNMISYIVELNKKPEESVKTIPEIKEKYALPTAFQPFIKVLEEEMKWN